MWFGFWLVMRWAVALPSYAALEPRMESMAEDPFEWRIDPTTVVVGQEGRLRLTLGVPEGHVVYRDELSVSVAPIPGLRIGPPSYPPGARVPDPASVDHAPREQYPSDVVIHLPLSADLSAAGLQLLSISVRHRGCRPGLCLKPVEQVISHPVTVVVGDDAAAQR